MHFTFCVHVAHTLNQLTEELQYFFFGNSLFDEISEGSIWAKLNEYVDAVFVFLKSIVAHNVRVNKRRECF